MIELLILLFTSSLHGRKVDQHKHVIVTEPIGYCGCWMRDTCKVPGCDYVMERRCNKDEYQRYLKGGR